MAIMATHHPECAGFDEKLQPVPSSEMKMMALDVNINGNSTRDDNNAVSALSETNSPSRGRGSTNIKVNGDANMDAFFSNQIDAPLIEFPAGSPPTQGTSASADNPNSSPLPDTNTTTTETQHLSPDPSTLLPPAEAAVESAVADTTATSTIPPIVEAKQSDLRHSSNPPLQAEVDSLTTQDHPVPTLAMSIDPQVQSDSALAMDLDTGMDGGQSAEQVSHNSPSRDVQDGFDNLPAATPPPPSSQIFPISPEAEVNLRASPDSKHIAAEAAADTNTAMDGINFHSMSPSAEGSKIARSREPDEFEEPSAKRFKTGPMALDSPVAHSNDEVPDDEVPPRDDRIDDASNDVAAAEDVSKGHTAVGTMITPYMVKELVKLIKSVARTKHGRNFKAPVAQLWPTLADQYAEKVPQPIDLQTMENKLVENVYVSLAELQSDVKLLHDNTLIFNGPNHVVTNSAQEVRDSILAKSDSILPEPPAPVKVPKKAKRASPAADFVTPVAPAARPSRAAAIAAPPTPTFALDPTTNTPLIRRDSAKGDGRPKREIHPPKNKDLPYNSRPKNRKTTTELKFCEEALNELKKPKYHLLNGPFMSPVDPVALGIPNYFSVIKNPMDFSTITSKLGNGDYAKAKDFEHDIRLVFSNCFKFNPEGNPVHAVGKQLEEVFDNKWSQKAQWIQEHSPAAMSPASQEHSDAESEEDDGDGIDEPALQMPGQASERLIEEQQKLITLMRAKKPDAFMVQLQQDMIAVIEKKVVEEKAAAALKASLKKSNKKSKATKPAKKAAPIKKAGVGAPKKQAAGRQKYMGTFEKEVVSMGIAQLPENIAAQVLDWLRAEHQVDAEEDGTIEMDIELLSHGTLCKIHDAVVRHVPGIEAQVKRELNLRDAPRPPAKPAAKKKHKPMNKVEQERRIDALKGQVNLFERHGSGSQEPLPTPDLPKEEESSGDEDSDSEEE